MANTYPLDRILAPLPDLLTMDDGTEVTTADRWQARRREILARTVELEFGGMPPLPEFQAAERLPDCEIDKTVYRITTGRKACPISFDLTLHIPEGIACRPVILTGDGGFRPEVLAEAARRGYVLASFSSTDLAPDHRESPRSGGLFTVWPELTCSTLSVWAWGYSRAIDLLLTLPRIDPEGIAITGHSRGGKAVLLAGVVDERVRFVNPNNSGGHGCGCYRYEQHEEAGRDRSHTRNERLDDLLRAFPHWLGEGMAAYGDNISALPHDMHFFKALIAPRCFLETEARGDIWSNPRGSYQTYLAAREVYRLLGCEQNCAAWYREGGHSHGLADYLALMDYMDAIRAGVPLSDAYTQNPYSDMKPMPIA